MRLSSAFIVIASAAYLALFLANQHLAVGVWPLMLYLVLVAVFKVNYERKKRNGDS